MKDEVFAVSLDGIVLSAEQEARIESGIKEVVMRELAKIDLKGDFVINRKLELKPRFKDFFDGGRTRGLWIEDIERFKKRMPK